MKRCKKVASLTARTRFCPQCRKPVVHTREEEKLAAERCGARCRKCHHLSMRIEVKLGELVRFCPGCGREMHYVNKYVKIRADEGSAKCNECRSPKGEQSKMYGFRHTAESKAKMVRSQLAVPRKGKKNPLISEKLRGPSNPMRGKKHTPETKAKMSAVRKGVPKPEGFGAKITAANKGTVHDEERRRRNSEAQKRFLSTARGAERRRQSSEVLKRLRSDPEFIKKTYKGMAMKPNRPEQWVGEILNRMYPDEYKYTGDGSFTIDGMAPDFTNVNGQKKVIEIFGERFHDPELSLFPLSERRTENGRKAAMASFGYQTLVIWSKEIFRRGIQARQELETKIKVFHES